jgi:hypothetical protein
MSLSPISFVAVNYRDYPAYWFKAYQPGTTTPLALSLDAVGSTYVSKLQLNADGFLNTTGGALVTPYINEAYDAWLFPTEAEADANDTSNAIRVADDITGINVESALINDLSQEYIFDTMAAAVASTIAFPVGKQLRIGDRGNALFNVVLASGVTPNTYNIVASTVQPTLAFDLDGSVNGVANVKQFGAVGDGLNDDTNSIQAAIDYIFNNGGGTVYFPTGTYSVITLVQTWTSTVTVNFIGEGKNATLIAKRSATVEPIFDLNADTVLIIHSTFKGMRIAGNGKAQIGIKAEQLARFIMEDIRIDTCDVGLENLGSLVFNVYDCSLNGCNIGYRSRKSGVIYANLVNFFGGTISGNSEFGMDIGEATGVHLYSTEVALNGVISSTTKTMTIDNAGGYAIGNSQTFIVSPLPDTLVYGDRVIFPNGGVVTLNAGAVAGVTTVSGHLTVATVDDSEIGTIAPDTGGIYIRDTCDDESGLSQIALNAAWMEANNGFAIRTDTVQLNLTIKDSFCINTKSQPSVDVGLIQSLIMSNFFNATTGDTCKIAARNSVVIGGSFYHLDDYSQYQTHLNPATFEGQESFNTNRLEIQQASGNDFTLTDDTVVGGSANDVTFRKLGAGVTRFRTASGNPLNIGDNAVGFYGAAPRTKQAVTGANGGNAALVSLLGKLEFLGLITDSST